MISNKFSKNLKAQSQYFLKNYISILFEKLIENEKVIKQSEWFFWFFWQIKSFPFNSEVNSTVSYNCKLIYYLCVIIPLRHP